MLRSGLLAKKRKETTHVASLPEDYQVHSLHKKEKNWLSSFFLCGAGGCGRKFMAVPP